jgi:purine-binding chemotaxis protein CheW
VIFTLHDALYAFEGVDVKEILPHLEVFPVPGAPQTIPGVINNRGDIEAVINLHAILGLPQRERNAHSRIVMTEKAGVRSGMLVDSVIDVVDLPQSSLKSPLATLDDTTRELVTGETIYQGRSVVLLDLGRIIDILGTHGRRPEP